MKASEILRHACSIAELRRKVRPMADAELDEAMSAALTRWRARYAEADAEERAADGCKFCGAYWNEDCRQECGCEGAEEARRL